MDNVPHVSEIAKLIIALAVLPFIAKTVSALRMSGRSRPWFAVTVGAVYASYVFTTVEALGAPAVFDALQDLAYGVGGIFGLLTALDMRRQVLEERRA